MYNYLLLIIITILSFSVCSAQKQIVSEPEKNWLAEYNIYPTKDIYFRYDRYSKDDLKRFREKLDLLKNSKTSSEWNGTYYIGTEETVNHSELHIDRDQGFVSLNIYTCQPELRFINYGKIVETQDSILISPEFASDSPRKSKPIKYVKIKWGEKYLLVEESILPIFVEKAVGIYVEPEDDSNTERFKWTNFWVKGSKNLENHFQVENDYSGLPEIPESYKQFTRLPIEAKIIAVEKRTLEKADVAGNGNSEFMEAVYKVKINAGKNKGVKIGMTFDVPEIGEKFVIDQVNQNESFGKISRRLDENKVEFCADNNFEQIACPKITNFLKVKTQIGIFWF